MVFIVLRCFSLYAIRSRKISINVRFTYFAVYKTNLALHPDRQEMRTSRAAVLGGRRKAGIHSSSREGFCTDVGMGLAEIIVEMGGANIWGTL
jgi:hypothetical protein